MSKTFSAVLAILGILLLAAALVVGVLAEREPYEVDKATEFPTPTQEVILKSVMVNVGTANIRSGPSTDSEIVDTAHYGDVILVLAEVDGWYQFDEGWIKASLTEDK